ncbi:ligand-gated chloride channel subunit, partial [Aphelenchoides avenae]
MRVTASTQTKIMRHRLGWCIYEFRLAEQNEASGLLAIFALFAWPTDAQSKALKSRQIGTQGQILARMFSEYDPETRPPVRGCHSISRPANTSLPPPPAILPVFTLCFLDSADHSAIVVILSVFINRVVWDVHTAEVDLYLRQQWEDGRLHYDIDVREGIHEVVVPKNRRLWEPDTYITNADEMAAGNDLKRVVVEPTGYVRTSQRRTVVVNLEDETGGPFQNKRSFKLKLSSYNYPIEDVVYVWANSPPTVLPVEVAKELIDGPYAFLEAYASDCAGNYSSGVYSCLDVVVSFEGSSAKSIAQTLIPSILLVVVSWFHFWIHGSWSVPRTASAAVPFFIFFALLVFYPQPQLETFGFGALQVWLIGCLIFTFLSLLEYFIVIGCGIHRRVTYVNGVHSTTHTTDPHAPLTPSVHETIEIERNPKCANFRTNHGFDVVSRVVFPVAFFIFLIIFLIV